MIKLYDRKKIFFIPMYIINIHNFHIALFIIKKSVFL